MDLAIIVDIDGTMCNNKRILDKYSGGPKEGQDAVTYWQDFVIESLWTDANEWCLQLVKDMKKGGVNIIFMTSRSDSQVGVEYTRRWLDAVLPDDFEYTLIMRPKHDLRPCADVKRSLTAMYVTPKYHVLFAVDDQVDNVNMFKSIGVQGLLC